MWISSFLYAEKSLKLIWVFLKYNDSMRYTYTLQFARKLLLDIVS